MSNWKARLRAIPQGWTGEHMGRLVQGIWRDEWYDTNRSGGRFERRSSHFRNWVTPDGSPGPTGTGGFAAESGRYHLYVSYACPWAHRTLILRSLKGLEPFLPVSVVHWKMGPSGWSFEPGPGVVPDPVHGAPFLSDVSRADPQEFDGHATTPVLW